MKNIIVEEVSVMHALSIVPDMLLNDKIIDIVKREATQMVISLMKNDIVEVILYGSCARGDYTADSDIDIALITNCDRNEVKKYDDGIDEIATELAMRYFAIVNFVCIPYDEFNEKKSWYGYFHNIAKEGEVLYG
jgi:predicted nucleotidyltransferase